MVIGNDMHAYFLIKCNIMIQSSKYQKIKTAAAKYSKPKSKIL